MDGRQAWRVVDGPAAVEVRLEMWQTLEATALRGEVTLDGQPLFARAWSLDLREAPWRIAR